MDAKNVYLVGWCGSVRRLQRLAQVEEREDERTNCDHPIMGEACRLGCSGLRVAGCGHGSAAVRCTTGSNDADLRALRALQWCCLVVLAPELCSCVES